MKNMKYILLALFLIGCASSIKVPENSSAPTRFVFRKSMVFTERGISNLNSKTDSLIDVTYNQNGKDSLTNKSLKEIQMTDFLTQTPDTEIHVEVQNDSIWRYTMQDGSMIGDYLMIQKNNGVLNYYDKSKSLNYRKYDLFEKNREYEIVEDRNDTKEIKGFVCYKLILILKEPESDLGNTIYNMYVSDKINLPIHSVLNVPVLVPNTFPMEIKIDSDNLSGLTEKYELIEVE
jgi:hypothetical protein